MPSSNFLYSSNPLPEWASGVHIIYDGDCPFCSSFVRFQRLREAIGKVDLLNAREHPELVHYFSSIDMPLDEGMVLVIDGQIYYGADCLNRMAFMSSKVGLFNQLTATLFRSPGLSRFLYPILKLGRRVVLAALGRKPL